MAQARFKPGELLTWNPEHPDVFFAKRQLGDGPFVCRESAGNGVRFKGRSHNWYSANLFTNNKFLISVMTALNLSTTDNSSDKEKEIE